MTRGVLEIIKVCEYCGKELRPLILPELMGKKNVQVGWKDCGCEKEQEAIAEAQYREMQKEERKKEQRIGHLIVNSRIPKRYQNVDLEDESLYEMAFKDGLYIFGDVGTGKTTKACAIGLRAIQSDKSVLFYKAYELSSLSIVELSELAKVDLLIIDDIGSENTSEWGNTRLRIAIDGRYDSMLPIVITSNYSKDQLKKLLLRNVKDMTPKSIVSRLTEMTKEVKVDGEDMRFNK